MTLIRKTSTALALLMLASCQTGGDRLTQLDREVIKDCPLISGAGPSLLIQGQKRDQCLEDLAIRVEHRICNMPMDAERLLLTEEYLEYFWPRDPTYKLSNLPFSCKLADE
jgi:hypothetical protein